MPVLLASGMVFVSTARTRIRSASRTMLSGVSNVTPPGAGPNVRSLWYCEWQGWQRCAITARTVANDGTDSLRMEARGAADPFGVERNIAPASANAAGSNAQGARGPRPSVACRTAERATDT